METLRGLGYVAPGELGVRGRSIWEAFPQGVPGDPWDPKIFLSSSLSESQEQQLEQTLDEAELSKFGSWRCFF